MKKFLAILVLGLALTFSSNGISGEMNVFKKKIIGECILAQIQTSSIEEAKKICTEKFKK